MRRVETRTPATKISAHQRKQRQHTIFYSVYSCESCSQYSSVPISNCSPMKGMKAYEGINGYSHCIFLSVTSSHLSVIRVFISKRSNVGRLTIRQQNFSSQRFSNWGNTLAFHGYRSPNLQYPYLKCFICVQQFYVDYIRN